MIYEMMKNRRSIRTYTGEAIPDEVIDKLLAVGLMSESSCNRRARHFLLVRNKEMLEKLSHCRVGSAKMLAGADAAIVVLGDTSVSEIAVEDCAAAISNMHIAADAMGLGSCWIQCRMRQAEDGSETEDYLRGLLHFPAHMMPDAILSLGMPQGKAAPQDDTRLEWEKVHRETY